VKRQLSVADTVFSNHKATKSVLHAWANMAMTFISYHSDSPAPMAVSVLQNFGVNVCCALSAVLIVTTKCCADAP
jgi:hypothetical protein